MRGTIFKPQLYTIYNGRGPKETEINVDADINKHGIISYLLCVYEVNSFQNKMQTN